MSVKKYTCLFVFFLVLTSSLIAAINYSIDPYMLYQSTRISGLNDKKPAAANRSTLYKPYNVNKIRPQTIIVGNSRPEMGLDPKSTCWPAETGVIYNLTFPGQSMYNQVRAMFHAVADGEVKNIVLAVDFADFLYDRSKQKKNFWPKRHSEFLNRLLVDGEFQENKEYWINKISDYSSGLFTLNALNDSIYTLLSQSPNSTNRTNLGFNPAKDYLEIIRYEGAWVLFESTKNQLQKRYFQTDLSIYDSEQWSIELEAIKRVIQLVINKNIQLIIFINPYHYTYLETILKAGYWSEFENFKKSLAHTVNAYGNNQVALWDFALYSNYTVSSVPQKGIDSGVFHWFWEPAHYKAELGELLLRDLFEQTCIKDKINTKPVGIKLNNLNIRAHLLSQKERRTTLLQQIQK